MNFSFTAPADQPPPAPPAPTAPAAFPTTPAFPAVPEFPTATLQDALSPEPAPEPAPEQEHQDIEREIGEKIGQRKRSLQEIAAAATRGILVSVEVRYWRGRSALTSEDLGLTAPDSARFAKQYLTNGQKTIVPPDLLRALTSAENLMRGDLQEFGFQVGGFGRFIPVTQFNKFRERFLKHKEAFVAAVEAMAAAVDGDAKAKMRQEFRILANHSWLGARHAWTENNTSPAGSFSHADNPTPMYVETYIERVMAKIPPAGNIRQDAYAGYKLERLVFPDTSLAVAFSRHPDLQNDYAACLATEKREKIDLFLLAARDAVASQVMALVENINGRIADKGRLQNRSVVAALGAVVELKNLNVLQDKEVDETLSQLEQRLQRALDDATVAKAPIDCDSVVTALREAAERAVAMANQVEINEFGDLG